MPYWVYILQSRTSSRYYCGFSSNLEQRLKQHNDPSYRLTRTTKILKGPWKIVWSQAHATRGDAMKLEKTIKRRGIQRFLEDNEPC